MPRPDIHLKFDDNLVSIISCSHCGREVYNCAKNYNQGKCKRCGKEIRYLFTAATPAYKFRFNEAVTRALMRLKHERARKTT
jgi:DNA-directed RNA polymerase subunit RPC12/RpoP